ncbi:hypothetical protein M9458_055531 [Cirrhinus mrigala]|uniref:Uncharacterized protein n=1 Tax=Cirrhinus mrigala TaxID=683832 RepID=A0ABD0MFT5_CIRMR
MCSFTVLGGPKTSQVSGVTTTCLTQCNTFPLHRVDQVVDCGLWNVGPLLFNGCAKLLDIGRNWNIYPNAQCSMGDMSSDYAGHARTGMFSVSRNCDHCNMGPCIIMLQHEVMVVDEWHNNRPQDLVTVSLCIQNAINKMHLCSLSITFAYQYHNPTATMGHSIQNVDTANPHNAIHAVCHLPCTVKTGIHPWRERLSKVTDVIECEHLPTQVSYDDELQSGRDPDEDDEHADELP